MNNKGFQTTLEKLTGYQEEKKRLDASIATGNRKLRTLEFDKKNGKEVLDSEIKMARTWVTKLENRLITVESGIKMLSREVSKVGDKTKRETASGKRVRL